MREKSKDEKEMFLMEILSSCLDTYSSTKRGKKRSRVRTHFAINGASVCRETFQLFFNVLFSMNTSEEIGLPYPTAPRGKDNIPIVFLPSSTPKLH
ncbi:hypothetical protein DPMN_135366 [Dreissena polymorpha]|uniref:Uncharacterized protein n=1 Tax=Dreissena polymorpha TaxID=45954 RepID=A0A9D4JEL5_DREPO|nr:hypothetical protein DPMN_135366 [Dreissena polymorpha]